MESAPTRVSVGRWTIGRWFGMSRTPSPTHMVANNGMVYPTPVVGANLCVRPLWDVGRGTLVRADMESAPTHMGANNGMEYSTPDVGDGVPDIP